MKKIILFTLLILTVLGCQQPNNPINNPEVTPVVTPTDPSDPTTSTLPDFSKMTKEEFTTYIKNTLAQEAYTLYWPNPYGKNASNKPCIPGDFTDIEVDPNKNLLPLFTATDLAKILQEKYKTTGLIITGNDDNGRLTCKYSTWEVDIIFIFHPLHELYKFFTYYAYDLDKRFKIENFTIDQDEINAAIDAGKCWQDFVVSLVDKTVKPEGYIDWTQSDGHPADTYNTYDGGVKTGWISLKSTNDPEKTIWKLNECFKYDFDLSVKVAEGKYIKVNIPKEYYNLGILEVANNIEGGNSNAGPGGISVFLNKLTWPNNKKEEIFYNPNNTIGTWQEKTGYPYEKK